MEEDTQNPITPQEFAKKVKAKYPQYANVDDITLAKKMVEKYPEYASQVNFDSDVKKKDIGVSSTQTPPQGTTASPLAVGSLATQSPGNKEIPVLTKESFAKSMSKEKSLRKDMSGKSIMPEKRKEKAVEGDYIENIGTVLKSGLNDVNQIITSIPETLYSVFSIPQNAVAYVTGLDMSTNPEKFKKTFGVENTILNHYKEEGKKLEQETADFNKNRYESSSVYENLTNGNYQDAFELLGSGIARSAPTSIALMAGGAALSTGELAAASTAGFYNQNLEQLQEENPNASDIENNIKALGMAASESVFSAIGEGQIGAVYRDIIKKEGVEAGKQVFKDGLVQMYKSALEKYGMPIGLLGEGIEEGVTQITQNMISGKPAFEGAADAFILGGGSGAMFTAPISLMDAHKRIKGKITEIGDNKKINEILGDTGISFNKLFDVPKDSEIDEKQLSIASLEKSRDLLAKKLAQGVKNGDVTDAQAKQSLYVFDKTKQISGQLRDVDIDDKSKVKVANLLKERESLSEKITGKDEALTVLEKQRVADINEEIKQTILKSKNTVSEYIIDDKPYSKEEFLNKIKDKTQDELKAMKIVVNNDEQTSKDINDKFKANAIQEPSPNESVLRAEQPEVELQGVGEGNAKPEGVTEESITTEKPEEIKEPSVEQQLKDVNEGNVVTFEYKNENEVPEIFKDKISSKGENNGEPFVKVTMAKSLADFHLQEKPTQETIPEVQPTATEKPVEVTPTEVKPIKEQWEIDYERRKAKLDEFNAENRPAAIEDESEDRNEFKILDRQNSEKRTKLQQNVFDAQENISRADDADAAIEEYNKKKKELQDFDNETQNMQNVRDVNDLIYNEIEYKEKDGDTYEFPEEFNKDPRKAALKRTKEMIDFLEERNNENDLESIDRYKNDIKLLEQDIKENPLKNNTVVAESKAEVAPAVETDVVEEKVSMQPKNIKDLYNINRKFFILDRLKSLSSAIVMDRMVENMAKRGGISKKDMYGKLKFEKILEKNLPQGVKFQVDAWHGSPYEFDKFQTGFMGTGEGAQAFGWGLYFTDIEDIAKKYQALTSKNKNFEIWIGDNTAQGLASEYYKKSDRASNGRLSIKFQDMANFFDVLAREFSYSKALEELRGSEELQIWVKNNVLPYIKNDIGSLYKVSLHKGKTPDQYTWLEWDKPVNESTRNKIIKKFLEEKNISNEQFEQLKKEDIEYADYEISVDIFEEAGVSIKDGVAIQALLGSEETGLKIYNSLTNSFNNNPKDASIFLLESGIDGIKYPTDSIGLAFIEQKLEKGFNYVVFDENAVSIEEVIKFQKDANKARGAMMINLDGQAIIYALTDPNISTPLHEMAHVFEHYLSDKEKATVIKEAGTNEWNIETSEYFARGFEKYLADGIAPTKELQRIFNLFKNWLLDIYNGITGSDIDIKLNKPMRKLYDSMVLGVEDNKVTQGGVINGINDISQIMPIQEKFNELMEKADKLIAIQKSRGITEKKIISNLDTMVRKSDIYTDENTNDAQRKIMEREARAKMGAAPKKAVSIGRVIGALNDIKNVSREEKLKIIGRIRELSRDAVKDLKEEINSLAKGGKITPTQAVNIISRFGKVNMLNEISVSNFVDYMAKVFNDADYDNKINVAKGKLKNAKKNINTKIGIANGLVSPLQTLFSINPNLIPIKNLERYIELVNMFSSREAVLQLDEISKVTNDVNEILDEIDNELSVADELSFRLNYSDNKIIEDGKLDYAATIKNMVKKGEITQDEADIMAKYKSEIIPQVEATKKTDEEIAQERAELEKELKKSTINSSDLPTRDERNVAKRIAEHLKKPLIKELSNPELKNLIKGIDNINNGYLPHQVELILEKLDGISDGKTITNSINKANLKKIAQLVNFTYNTIKSKIRGKETAFEMIRRTPLFNIDQILGDFKTEDLYYALLGKSAKAEAKFSFELKTIQDKLQKAQDKIAKSEGYFKSMNPLKAKISNYKIRTYQLQLENNSNPGDKRVNPAAEYINATIKHIKKLESQYNENDVKILEDILKEFAPDGQIDIDKLYNSFNSAEKEAIKTFQEIKKFETEMAEFTGAVIRGKRIVPLNNHTHISVLSDTSKEDLDVGVSFANEYNDSLQPSTKAKNLMERTPGAKPINFDAYSTALKSVKYVLMDYNLTAPVRTARKAIKAAEVELEKNGEMSEEKRRIFNSVRAAFELSVTDLVMNSYVQTSTGQDIVNFISKQGYRAVLAGLGKSGVELISNIGFVVFDPFTFYKGAEQMAVLLSEDLPAIMNNSKSIQINRVSASGLSGRMIDVGILDQSVGTKSSKTRGKIINKAQQIWNLTGKKFIKNPVELTADVLITSPDKIIMKPYWLGSYITELEKQLGRKVTKEDLKKIAENDEQYMNENEAAIEAATRVADRKSKLMGATKNAFAGLLRGKTRVEDKAGMAIVKNFNSFMTNFMVYEFNAAKTGVMAAVGQGTMSKKEGAAVLAGVITRMTVYNLLIKAVSSGVAGLIGSAFGFEDDEEEKEKTAEQLVTQSLTSTFATLMMGRDFGNISKTVVNYGFEEYVTKEYLEGLRTGEYDPYNDAILFNSLQRDEKTGEMKTWENIPNFMGSYGPMAKTVALGVKSLSTDDKKTKEARERQEKERNIRLPLEIMGNLGYVPLYKEIRKSVMDDIYKGLKDKKSKKGLTKEEIKKLDPEMYEIMYGKD